MLILCHLFIGVVIGAFLFIYLGRKELVALSVLGSVLPDLIDKPLGQMIFNDEIGNGRILAHGLIFIMVIMGIGIVSSRSRYGIPIIALGLGAVSHQILDAMFLLPVNWMYPLLGPFPHVAIEDYLEISLIREITSPSEWMFGVLFLVVASLVVDELSSSYPSSKRIARWSDDIAIIVLTASILGLIAMLLWDAFMTTSPLMLTEIVALAIVAIGAGVLVPALRGSMMSDNRHR